MYAVIFRAVLNQTDEEYNRMAAELRTRALEQYGCVEFTACTEGDREIAISYWKSEAQIRAWKADPLHRSAQQLGQTRWYRSYRVEIVELLQAYSRPTIETDN